jgi:hypothetical protein
VGTIRDEDISFFRAPLVWCGFFLSFAIFFRFSLAPLYFALAAYLVFALPKGARLRGLMQFGIGGAMTAVLMSLLELLNGKMPFSTALEFVKYNFDAHIATQSYGSMPWHMYIGIVLLFPIPGAGICILVADAEGCTQVYGADGAFSRVLDLTLGDCF